MKKIKSIYIIGSLRNPKIVDFANELEKHGFDPFSDWKSPGPNADDHLRDWAKARGLNYKQTLKTYAARHIFEFDRRHLSRCNAAILLMPAGRSGHLEAGFAAGKGKPVFVLFDSVPERIDIMYQFCTDIFFSQDELFKELEKYK